MAFQLQATRCLEVQAHRCHPVVLSLELVLIVQVPGACPEPASPVDLKANKVALKVRSLNQGPPSFPRNQLWSKL